jgi:hypothetical protein
MTISLNTNDGFQPTSQVGNKKGLHWKKGSSSSATLNGSGLINGLAVSVDYYSRGSGNASIQWTGTTQDSNSDNTSCTVNLTEVLDNDGPHHRKRDDDTTVSVTASDVSTQQSSNTINPTVPVAQ